MKKKEVLKDIATHLMIYSSTLNNIGLYHGKMGLILFFVHYSHYVGNTLFEDFAYSLLDDIYNEIDSSLSFDFENGLSGIGWAIEYLLQNGFMNGDSDDILEDIDRKIMEYDPRRITDKSFRSGLRGVSIYIQMRLTSSCRKSKKKPFDPIYLSDWATVSFNQKQKLSHSQLLLKLIKKPCGSSIIKWPLGLENGCAGYGLNYLIR